MIRFWSPSLAVSSARVCPRFLAMHRARISQLAPLVKTYLDSVIFYYNSFVLDSSSSPSKYGPPWNAIRDIAVFKPVES